MKTSLTILWIAFVGAVAAFTIHEIRQSRITTITAPVKVDLTPQGVRVPITNGTYEKFETVLNTIDPNGANGSCVNILFQTTAGDWQSVNGPPFAKPPQAVQPDGSMHVTQTLLLGSLDQLNDVLSLLETNVTKPTTIQAQCSSAH
jgi:hypothetical protein